MADLAMISAKKNVKMSLITDRNMILINLIYERLNKLRNF
jgi:hypothetical protein